MYSDCGVKDLEHELSDIYDIPHIIKILDSHLFELDQLVHLKDHLNSQTREV